MKRVKLTNAKLNKLESTAKYKTWTMLRITDINFQDEELSHKLSLATIQKTKIRNAFAKICRPIYHLVMFNSLK